MYLELLYIFASLLLNVWTYRVEVKVKQGRLIGTRGATVFEGRLYYAFYGVPYAQPPLKGLRFKDPRPVKKWKKPFDASAEHHVACAQPHIVSKNGLFGHENCLHLNIYTPYLPKDGERIEKAVIVWIHGFAFTSSFSHIHGADFLLDNDVLFVSLTHRISVFGFLKLNDTDTNANMGLKDIVMALKWIRKNIIKFGGDKNRISVMGNGSAGTFLSLLLTTKYRKLFSQIILLSGTSFSPSLFQGDHVLERERLSKELKKIGYDSLISASTKDIVAASLKIYNSKEIMNTQRPLVQFTPIIENVTKESLLTKKPGIYYKRGVYNFSMPLLIGFNSQESISEVMPFLHNPTYLRTFASFFKYMVPFQEGCRYNYTQAIYTEIGNKIKNKYFDGVISEKSILKFVRYMSDITIYPMLRFIKTHLKFSKGKIFVYKFNYIGNFSAVRATSTTGTNIRVKGSASGDEICYVLKCEPMWENYVSLAHTGQSRDKNVIIELAKMWSNFAKYGNPTPPAYDSTVTWLPISATEDHLFEFRKVNKLSNLKQEQKMFSFWEDIYKKYYSKENCKKNIHDEL